jgi:hypothetical protein
MRDIFFVINLSVENGFHRADESCMDCDKLTSTASKNSRETRIRSASSTEQLPNNLCATPCPLW